MPANKSRQPEPFFPGLDPINELLASPPTTARDYVVHMRILRARIHEHVRFMCGMSKLGGSSPERKKEALAAFYKCLRDSENALSEVRQALQLD